jgi:large subunit ribosomal protein L21
LTFESANWYNSLFGGPTIYAIIETGGKQYRVSPGQVIDVDFLDEIDGSTVEIDRVLLVGDGDKTLTGTPIIEGAKVIATSQGEVRGDKVLSFRYKNKTRSHRKMGHHQTYTRLAIDKIVSPGSVEK